MAIPRLTDHEVDLSEYVTVAGAAVAAESSVASVWRWVKRGLLPPPTRILGRSVFRLGDVKALLKRRAAKK